MIGAMSAPQSGRAVVSYVDQRIALLTQHGKEHVIAPVLHAAVGCRVERVSGYDTDLLGTFTRNIARAGTQIEAARTKANMGMQLSGLPVGLASEGSFGGDPMLGVLPWNVELVLWIDAVSRVEIQGVAQGRAVFGHSLVTDWGDVENLARQWGFPEHHLVVRPETDGDLRIRKGISSWSELDDAYARARAQSANGSVFLETDARAHANPTRQLMIGQAAQNLAAKLQSLCPACGAPGYWRVERIPGLPCRDCGAPSQQPIADIHGCVRCTYRQTHDRAASRTADPGRCDYCNP